jgi:exopolysaccharide production protein ExoQ
MAPLLARESGRAESGASRTRSVRSGNRALIGLLALTIWLRIVLSTVDFESLVTLPRAGAAVANVAVLAPNLFTRALKIAWILIGALVIFAHMKEARVLIKRVNVFFLAFLMLALISVVWSYDPSATLARCVSLIATVLICCAFCLVGWHRERFQNVSRPVLTLLLAASIVYIVVVPDYALDFDGAGYHGISTQKNPFGELCALATLLWMQGWISGEVKAYKAIGGALLGWTCLWLSKSATSFLATAFASLLILMILRTSPAIRRYTKYLVVSFAALVIAYALAILQLVPGLATVLLGPITAITGKDMTFSNRAMIWDIIKEHAQFHPLLGTGFGAYWTGMDPSSPSYVFLLRMYFWPSEAHNGYLDVVNDLGFVGLIFLLGYLAVYIQQSLRLLKTDRPQGALYLALFFQQAMTNLSESCWFSPMGILPLVIMTLSTFTLARALIDQNRPQVTQRVASKRFPAPRNRMVLRR